MAALITLILGLTYVPVSSHRNVGIILIVVGVVLLVVFVLFEARQPYALIPLIIMRNRKMIFSLLSALFTYAV